MGKFTYSDGVAVWKVVFYVPTLLASLLVARRHGFTKSSGWIYLTIFCIVRIVGSVAEFVLISDPTSSGASTTALVCAVLGLSPLLLASLGLLARCYYSMLQQPWNTIFSLVVLRLVQTPALVALILCVVGATSANDPTEIYNEVTIKIGVILFAVVFAMLCLMCVIASIAARRTKRGEGQLIMAVAFALPFLLVRVIYALVAAFGHNVDFQIGNESTAAVTISLFMEVLEECVVVFIYIVTGLKLPAVPIPNASNGEGVSYRLGRGDFGGGKLELLSLGAAVMDGVTRKSKSNRHDQARQDDVERTRLHRTPN
ncbi:uncharacterized protein A1O9_06133 [Exophiala aquamarina CBS 119918]|uniref:DUF7702 domain-containing protein n=1 Tax=Exophiala aquamarina CBS 119918 TaxID=1182545 RepID=A0A072PEL6_9EURO|nr:uncharacterized protein A1O9_06133 [Exophiala aquamarina CBS 119918]KEF58207.1 hypothetical protein A1O9_06133 [Exophiala aquamarina CBS 119918]